MIGESNNNAPEATETIDNTPNQAVEGTGYSGEEVASENLSGKQPFDVAASVEEVGEVGLGSSSPSTDEGSSSNVSSTDEAVYGEAIQELESQVMVLKAQLDDRLSMYARLQADFENFRKRTQKEKEELEVQIKRSTIIELLPVVDNFDRARSQIKPQTDEGNNIHKSYQGVYKLLVDCLKRIGVSPMRSEGKEFDPMLHEAVIREATNEHPEGTVIEELVRGYLLGDKVLRHAMVKVAASIESDSATQASEM